MTGLKEKVEGWREITAQMEAEYAAPKRRDTGTKVSVIIPVYQAAATLTECVMSVRQQSYTDLEILLIDDGSTDESPAICERMAAQDDRVYVFHQENRGVSVARNKGLAEATGTYVMFVDADDELLPGAIETLMAYETESKADLISMGYINEIRVGQRDGYNGPPSVTSPDYTGGAAQTVSGYYYIDNCIFERDTSVWGKLFYRPALEGLAFDESLTIGEDMLFLVQLALRFESKLRIQLVPEAGYLYRDNPEGAMNKSFTPSYADNITCWEKCEQALSGHERKLSPYALTKLSCIRIMNAMLVVGKIALLPETEWQQNTDVIGRAKEVVRANRRKPGVFAALEWGYKLKTTLFLWSPEQYLRSYSKHKQ